MKQIVVAAALVGCGVEAGAPEPIARIPRANGNVVEYYETAPGTVVSEVGPAGNDFLDQKTLAMPREQLAATLAAEPVVVRDPSSPSISVGGACNQAWFTSTQCNYANWMWGECLVPVWNGAWATCDMNNIDASWFFTSVCADIGDVVLDVSSNVGAGGIWTVNQGYVRNASLRIYNGSLDAHSQVDSAQGDRLLFTAGCMWE